MVVRIAHRFQQRFHEWVAAVQIMLWGVVLLLPGSTFDYGPYMDFGRMASENSWGFFMLFIGLARIGGLIVNGARQDITPWIRATGAVFGFLIFGVLSLKMAVPVFRGYAIPAELAIYPPMAIAELVAFFYSLRDAKAYRDGRYRTA